MNTDSYCKSGIDLRTLLKTLAGRLKMRLCCTDEQNVGSHQVFGYPKKGILVRLNYFPETNPSVGVVLSGGQEIFWYE